MRAERASIVRSRVCEKMPGQGHPLDGRKDVVLENPIPDDLRSEHLFLLVGTNPLPDWVAAKLLVKTGGRVHLFSTDGVRKHAARLKKVLEETEKIAVSTYETAAADANVIYNDVERQVAKLVRGNDTRIGLNYTGGTKMMSVHAHRAVRAAVKQPERRILSYLDARELKLKFDDHPGTEPYVGTLAEVCISLKTLLALHDEYNTMHYDLKVICGLGAAGLVELHSDYSGQRIWRNWCLELEVGSVDSTKLTEDEYQREVLRLNTITIQKEDEFSRAVEAKLNEQVNRGELSPREARTCLERIDIGYRALLTEFQVQGGSSLQEVAQKCDDFKDSFELARWLDGMWLEHYTLAQVQSCATNALINPDGAAVNLVTLNKEGRKFEADVVALRGYQLFYFSCYTGSEPARSKQKLFEAAERATQLGGDEAKIGLVCNSDYPKSVRRQCEANWESFRHNRIRVFGRADLPRLANRLKEWFDGEPEQ